MSSNVGNAQVYEAADQRPTPEDKDKENVGKAYEEGKEGSHDAFDPKDERSIANRLAAAEPQNDNDSGKGDAESKAAQLDPTLPARMHGNEPSKGAKIDAQIMEDEEAEIAKKDAAKAQSKAAKK